MKKFLLTIFVFLPILTKSQDYVVTLKNDTLRGEAKIMTYDFIDRVQVTEGKKKTQFTAIQVRSVNIEKEAFHPVLTIDGYRLLKLVTPGYLSLYLARPPEGDRYDVPYLVKRDGSALEVPNLTFKKAIGRFLDDCAMMNQKIAEGEFGRKNLEQIIKDYNACIDNQTNTIHAQTVSQDGPKMRALTLLTNKIGQASSLPSQKDALDILKDITEKAKNNQTIPNYLLEGLKGLLKDYPDSQPELEKVLDLLKNP